MSAQLLSFDGVSIVWDQVVMFSRHLEKTKFRLRDGTEVIVDEKYDNVAAGIQLATEESSNKGEETAQKLSDLFVEFDGSVLFKVSEIVSVRDRYGDPWYGFGTEIRLRDQPVHFFVKSSYNVVRQLFVVPPSEGEYAYKLFPAEVEEEEVEE